MPDNSNADIWFTQSTMDVGDGNGVTAYALYMKD